MLFKSLLIVTSLAELTTAFQSTHRPFGVVQNAQRSSTSLSMSTGLYFSTIGGNTKRCAEMIAEAAGITKFCEIEDLPSTDEMLAHDTLIVGAPTWNTGAEKQRTMTGWDEWLYNVLPTLDLKGKKVAFFGVGDQTNYPFNCKYDLCSYVMLDWQTVQSLYP